MPIKSSDFTDLQNKNSSLKSFSPFRAKLKKSTSKEKIFVKIITYQDLQLERGVTRCKNFLKLSEIESFLG